MAIVLTIAGFDPSSGAGITADLAVFAAHCLFGTSAITALTVQSTTGVRAVHPTPGALLRQTLDVLAADLPAMGIKIGMLGSEECVVAVADFLESLGRGENRPVLVLDPVLRSSSGHLLLQPEGLAQVRGRLLPLVDWATPNLEELAILSNRLPDVSPGRERINAESAGLQSEFPGLGLIVTGGHMDPPDDLFLPPRGSAPGVWIAGECVPTTSTHGTGCAFSSAFVSNLVQGVSGLEAAKAAKLYVAEAMRRAVPMGSGKGPMNLMWPLGRGW